MDFIFNGGFVGFIYKDTAYTLSPHFRAYEGLKHGGWGIDYVKKFNKILLVRYKKRWNYGL